MSESQDDGVEGVRRIGVIGAGVMGSGIAQCTATAGFDTLCIDISPEVVERAATETRSGRYGIERGVERGKLTAAEGEAALARLRFGSSLEEAAQADLVIECVPERLDLKIHTFRELDRAAPDSTILASNTSGFSIAGIAAATDRPERVIGWHWASPPIAMRFAEIVRHEALKDGLAERVSSVARACGKNPIIVEDSPMTWGFVANRIYFAMVREAQRVVHEGVADHAQVNQLMVDCFNWPVGPFAMIRGASDGWKE